MKLGKENSFAEIILLRFENAGKSLMLITPIIDKKGIISCIPSFLLLLKIIKILIKIIKNTSKNILGIFLTISCFEKFKVLS